MRPRPGTLALGGVTGALLILGTVLGEGALITAAAVLILLLCLRAILFVMQVRSLVGSVELQRAPAHQILRQTTVTAVTTSIRCRVPAGFSVSFREALPPGTRVLKGESEGRGRGESAGGVTLSYDLQVLSRGDLLFSGLYTTVQDRYFTDTLLLGREPFRGPALHVQPAPASAEGEESHAEYGDREVPLARALSGQGIRSFRIFHTGDDMRAVDWKLSAKHGKMMVREYMGRAGGSPVFLLDLPADDEGGAGSDADHLIAALTTRIDHALREFSRTDVLVLSGGHVIRTATLHQDPRPWYRLQATLTPGDGYVPLYRHPFPLPLSLLHRSAERSMGEGEGHAFFSRLTSVSGDFLAMRSPTLFERELGAAFSAKGERELFIFSLFQGDLSHLGEAIRQAKKVKMPVHLRLPARDATPARLRSLLSLGAASVEVLP